MFDIPYQVPSRRTFLSLSALSAIAIAASPEMPDAFTSPDPDIWSALCEKWTDIITGRNAAKTADPRARAIIAKTDKRVATILTDLASSSSRTTVLLSANLQKEESSFITTTARAISSIACAWATPGSAYHAEPHVLSACIDALKDFCRLRYHPSQDEYGNWWDWEDGASRAIGDVMCILHDALPTDVMAAAAAGIDHFVPDPWYQQPESVKPTAHPTQPVISTGANRMDLTRAVICRSIATGDESKLRHAVQGLPDSWRTVAEGDGFRADGGFIQHSHVPYTGSYGDVLLSGLAMLLPLVAGTRFDITDSAQANLLSQVERGIVPVMYGGQILDCVRGRSISRIDEPAAMHGMSIARSMLLMANAIPAHRAELWRGTVHGWMTRNTFDHLSEPASLRDIDLFDTAANVRPIPESSTPTYFASIDRLVHRTPNWLIAVSNCSNRISWYEYGNSENEWASRTSQGMRYLMLPEDMGQYEDGFWATVDYSAPTGTTVDSTPLKRAVGTAWAERTPDNEWSGGLASGEWSAAASQITSQDSTLKARRLWVGLKDALLELTTDVSTDASKATTVVEHRKVGKTPPELLVDGITITSKTSFDNPRWAHLRGVGGYVFATDVDLTAQLEKRKGSWIDVNPARTVKGFNEAIERNYASLHVTHHNRPVAWAVLPTASRSQTMALAQRPVDNLFIVLSNDRMVQAVRSTGCLLTKDPTVVTTYAFWKPATCAGMTADAPAIIQTQAQGSRVEVIMSEPTQKRPSLTVAIEGVWTVENSSDRISVSRSDKTTTLRINTADLGGQSIRVTLSPALPKPTKPSLRASSYPLGLPHTSS
ncbi:polysaccharide lyase 8 family protein [Cutibacterium acnes]